MTQPDKLTIHPTWRPYVVLGFGLLAVASASILIRLAQADGASSLLIALWRLGLAALVLTPLVLARYRADLARLTRQELGLITLGGILLSIHFASWVTSLEYTSVISSVVLVATNPLFVALASPFLLHESLGRWTLVGIILAILGSILVSLTGSAGAAKIQGEAMFGNALAMVGSVAVAGYFVIGRKVRVTVSLIPYIWLTYGSGALLLAAYILLTRQPVMVAAAATTPWANLTALNHNLMTGLPPSAYVWMSLMALFPQLLGHSSYNYALGYLPAAYVSLTVLGEPIGSTILAYFIFHEQPGPPQLLGSALIFFALILSSREQLQSARKQDSGQPALISPQPSNP